MNRSALPLLVLTSALAACVAQPADTERAEQKFSTTPTEPNHEEITGAGLSFLRSEVVVALQAANVATDVQFVLDSAAHFDDCNFSGGSQRVAESEAAAVAAVGSGNDVEAMRMFGRALHAVQDFYAHSNWVELGGTTLVDRSLTAFPVLTEYTTLDPSGFLVVEGAPRKNVSLFRKQGAKYPENAIVTARIGKVTSFGLISGTVDYEPGDKCPAQIAMTHDELNKDKSTLTDRVPQYLAAKDLATQQTRHEWCRLLTMTRNTHGDAGDQRLFAWVSDANAASCGVTTDLAVTAAVANASIAVTYTNTGATSYGTNVRVNVPTGTIATGCTLAGIDAYDCYIGQVASGATGTVTLSVTASLGGAVTATIAGHVVDSDAANNTANATLAPIAP
jgi:hypothetical protein